MLEHSRTVRPSSLINLYLALSLPFDVARTRTLWLIGDFRHMAIVQTISLGIKIGILILEGYGKRKILLGQYQDLPPEATSGIYSRSVFWWLNPIFRVGFKKSLKLADLGSLDPPLRAEALFEFVTEAWMRTNKNRKHALLFAAFDAVKWSVLVPAFPRTWLIGAKYAQPFLLNRTTTYVANNESASIGWGLVGAYGLVYVSLGVLTASYTHLQNRCITMLRGGLISMIYAKTLDLDITAVEESSSMTLMSSDIERITESLRFMHDTWASIIEIGIAIFLLQRSVGLACIAPTIITILVTSTTAYVAKYSVITQKQWVEAIQTRIAFTSRMLMSMRSIKLLGLSDVVGKITQNLREVEVSVAQKFLWFFRFRVMMVNLPSIISPLATFAIFVISATITGTQLNTAQAYTALSLIQLMEEPLAYLLQSYTSVLSSLACYDRIQTYLESPSRYDHRLRLSGAVRCSPNPSLTAMGDPRRDVELQRLNTASNAVSGDCLVVQDASFGWSSHQDPVLHDINLRVRNGSFTFLIGPIGAGKSTLVKGILGEAHSSKGFVYASSTDIAFTDQDSWIRNGTIRENISDLSLYDRDWYSSVIQSCGLQQDIQAFSAGDDTRVGSYGLHLSGGQKQRLALARAVYCRKPILVLDDVFSGLDAETEEHIFTKLFGPHGILRELQTTVILVTHAIHRLPYSEHIVVIEDGTIREQGTYESLRNSGGYVENLAAHMRKPKKEKSMTGETESLQEKSQDPKLAAAAEDLARGSSDWSIYKYYAHAAGMRLIALHLGTCIVYSVALKGPELLIQYWATAVGKHGNSVNGFFMGIFSGLGAVSFVALILSLGNYFRGIVPRTSSSLHAGLLQSVMRAPLYFFTRTDSGSVTSRFSQDLAVVDLELPLMVVQTSFMIFFCIFSFILMLLSAGELAATFPFLGAALWAIQKVYLRTSRQMRLLDLEAKAPLFTQFQESLSGLASIRAFGWVERFRQNNLNLIDDSQKPFYFLFCIQRWLAVVLDLLVAGLAVVLMILGVFLRDKLNPGLVALALLNIMTFNQTLTSLIKSYTQLETSIGAISRIRSFIVSTEQEPKAEESIEPEDGWPSTGVIQISHFSASYSKASEIVLSDVNLSIKSGERIGICGRSGSGKSSLLSSLLHILEYRDGCVTIDNVDLSFVPRNLLRQRCKCPRMMYELDYAAFPEGYLNSAY